MHRANLAVAVASAEVVAAVAGFEERIVAIGLVGWSIVLAVAYTKVAAQVEAGIAH